MTMFTVKPDVVPQMQPTPTSCWLTCLEMLYIWKNNKGDESKKIGSILPDMDKSPNLYPYYMEKAGISPGECRETARMLGLGCAGDTAIFDAGVLTDALKMHGPLWVAGRWYMNCDHVIVVTGCDPNTRKINFINPWKNYSGEESSGTIEWLSQRGDEWSNCDASVMYWR